MKKSPAIPGTGNFRLLIRNLRLIHERNEMAERFYDLANDHAEWSQATFGSDAERGPEGPLNHLKREVGEAIDSPRDEEEYADLLLLVLDASRRAGISAPELVSAAAKKLDKNKEREWGERQPDGVFEHKRS